MLHVSLLRQQMSLWLYRCEQHFHHDKSTLLFTCCHYYASSISLESFSLIFICDMNGIFFFDASFNSGVWGLTVEKRHDSVECE